MEASGELVEDSLPLLGLPTEHQGLEEAPGRRARIRKAPSRDGLQAPGLCLIPAPCHPSSQSRLRALPEGTVQALATKLEEGQVLLSHSPAEVITVEGSGDKVWAEGLGRGPQAQREPGPAHILGPAKWGWGSRARQRPSQLDLGCREGKGQPGSGLYRHPTS